jgi:hypothetical protein
MDPNATLKELRTLAARILSDDVFDDDVAPSEAEARALRLAELVEALDQWLTRSGFLPAAWEGLRTADQANAEARATLLRQHRDTLVDAVMACEHTSGPSIETNKGRCTPIPVRRWQELLDVVDRIAHERSATREPRS